MERRIVSGWKKSTLNSLNLADLKPHGAPLIDAISAQFVVEAIDCPRLTLRGFMQPRCSICWTAQNLAKCSKEGCPNLLCTPHSNRYNGRCPDCWAPAVRGARHAQRLTQGRGFPQKPH
jgi:hypothetical protein